MVKLFRVYETSTGALKSTELESAPVFLFNRTES